MQNTKAHLKRCLIYRAFQVLKYAMPLCASVSSFLNITSCPSQYHEGVLRGHLCVKDLRGTGADRLPPFSTVWLFPNPSLA